MAIAWASRLSVAEYAAAGRKVDVPRPDCPNCGRPMTFEGSYPGSPVPHHLADLRASGHVHHLRAGPRPAAGFCDARPPGPRRGHRGSLVAGVGPKKDDRPAPGVPASTRRSWGACFSERSVPLTACLRALIVTYEGQVPRFLDQPMGPPERVAAVCLGAAWDAARRRCARAGMAIVAPWRFANLICGGALLATRVVLRPEAIGTGRTPRRPARLPPWPNPADPPWSRPAL